MSLEALGSALFWGMLVTINAGAIARCMMLLAARGTHLCYMALTAAIGLDLATTVMAVTMAVLCFKKGDHQVATFFLLMAVCLLATTFLMGKVGGDNWFNDQRKRLWRGIKKLRQRLTSLVPTPAPLPT
jgi:Kef-type K+ transport system membrane component KefB